MTYRVDPPGATKDLSPLCHPAGELPREVAGRHQVHISKVTGLTSNLLHVDPGLAAPSRDRHHHDRPTTSVAIEKIRERPGGTLAADVLNTRHKPKPMDADRQKRGAIGCSWLSGLAMKPANLRMVSPPQATGSTSLCPRPDVPGIDGEQARCPDTESRASHGRQPQAQGGPPSIDLVAA